MSREPLNMRKIIISILLLSFLPLAAFAADLPLRKSADTDIERSLAIKSQEKIFKLREDALDKREAELNSLQKDVESRISKLNTMQDEVTSALAEFKAVQSKNFKNLIKVYSAMSASKLAPLLNDMSDAEVAKILRAMKTNLVAKVIPKLKQQKAVAVSKLLGMLSGK